jgi:hypothetical protein
MFPFFSQKKKKIPKSILAFQKWTFFLSVFQKPIWFLEILIFVTKKKLR